MYFFIDFVCVAVYALIILSIHQFCDFLSAQSFEYYSEQYAENKFRILCTNFWPEVRYALVSLVFYFIFKTHKLCTLVSEGSDEVNKKS